MSKRTLTIIRLTALALFAVFLAAGLRYAASENETEAGYRDAARDYTSQSEQIPRADETPTAEDNPDAPAARHTIGADFAALKKVNADVKGWICIPDTPVNYPVVQGKDNSRYLYTGWNKKKKTGGSAFADAFEDIRYADNIVIYGHAISVRSSLMFSDVLKYKKKEYYEKHPYIFMSFADDSVGSVQTINGAAQPAGEYRFDIFGVCEADSGKRSVVDKLYDFAFEDEDEKKAYMNYVKEHSLYPIDIAELPVKVITLSTCAYPGSGKNTKLLVCAGLFPSTIESAPDTPQSETAQITPQIPPADDSDTAVQDPAS